MNELDQEENLLRRQFKIDKQLEHYYDALVKLVELFKLDKNEGLGFESIEDYVEKYNLFNEALKLRTLSKDMKLKLTNAWAIKMRDNGHQLQAALLFHLSKDYQTGSELFYSRFVQY